MNNQVQLQAIFSYIDDLLKALRILQEKNIDIPAVHSPVPHFEISAIMRKKPSAIRFITLCGGILGMLTGFGLSVYTAWQWKFVVSGKPPVPRVPYVIESFEFCILIGVLFNVIGMMLLSGLPKMNLPAYYDARVTEDRFSLLLNCSTDEQELVSKLLHDAGAEEVHAFS